MATFERFPGASLPRDGWRRELGLFALAYVLYNLGRLVTVGDVHEARAHARAIVDVERALGIAVEASVQDALDAPVTAWVLAHLYLAAQLVVVPLVLVTLYRRARPVYRTLRSTVLATWLLTLPVYALVPVAPPRLTADAFADTVSRHAVDLSGRSSTLYNELAAVPSLHAGFAFAVGVALAVTFKATPARVAALSWGPLVVLATVATGNHWILDAVAGVLVTAAGLGVARLVGTRTSRTRADQARATGARIRRHVPPDAPASRTLTRRTA